MALRLSGYDEAIDSFWDDLCFSEAALLAEKQTKELAAPFTAQLTRVSELRQEQWECWRKERQAAARVVRANYALDITVDDISRHKLNDLRNKNRAWKDKAARSSPEYTSYFPIAPYAIIKLGLESELPYVRPWSKALAGETSEDLLEIAPRLAEEIEEGDAAIKARNDAEEATALHRLRQINPFIDAVNKLRTDTYGKLLQLSQSNNFSRDWADLFFPAAQDPAPKRAEARGMSRALLLILEKRKLPVDDGQRAKITKNTELDVFDRWIERALTATVTAELFAE